MLTLAVTGFLLKPSVMVGGYRSCFFKNSIQSGQACRYVPLKGEDFNYYCRSQRLFMADSSDLYNQDDGCELAIPNLNDICIAYQRGDEKGFWQLFNVYFSVHRMGRCEADQKAVNSLLDSTKKAVLAMGQQACWLIGENQGSAWFHFLSFVLDMSIKKHNNADRICAFCDVLEISQDIFSESLYNRKTYANWINHHKADITKLSELNLDLVNKDRLRAFLAD